MINGLQYMDILGSLQGIAERNGWEGNTKYILPKSLLHNFSLLFKRYLEKEM